MKAVVYHTYGSPDVLELTEIEKPVPRAGEVLLEVRAAAVTPFDWHFLTGTPYIARVMAGLLGPKHKVLGTDVAGRVEAVGESAGRYEPGDEVFGRSPNLGGYAEYVCVPEAELWPKPVDMSFEEAATIPLSAITALICLCELGQLEAGQKVLINGASGGVGTLAVQIAKSLGADVTGVCSTKNLDMVRSIGADRAIDYTQDDFTKQGVSYDLIFDAVAKCTFSECKRALSPEGTYVTTAFSPSLVLGSQWASMTGSQKMLPMVPSPGGPGKHVTDQVGELIEAGQLRPVVDRHYTLSEVPGAFRYYAKGHTQGRVVITV